MTSVDIDFFDATPAIPVGPLIKDFVLNALFRMGSFIHDEITSDFIQDSDRLLLRIEGMAQDELRPHDITLATVQDIVNPFIRKCRYFREFISISKIAWPHDKKGQFRKVRVYLHKVHKLAPVFDYKRARENIKRLHVRLLMNNLNISISTRLAVLIYITDHLDEQKPFSKPLVQKNLRYICGCSAYAFHRARNNLGI